MANYNFNKINVVPQEDDFIEIIRIRNYIRRNLPFSFTNNFYSREMKGFKSQFVEKLSAIIDEFPGLDDICPLDGNDLLSTADYQTALDQIREARDLISNIFTNHVKTLKIVPRDLEEYTGVEFAALGQACMAVRRIAPSLAYLEETRRRLAMLPCVVDDPNACGLRLRLISGEPSTGSVDPDFQELLKELVVPERGPIRRRSILGFAYALVEREKAMTREGRRCL